MMTATAGHDVCVASGSAKCQMSAWGARKTFRVGVCCQRGHKARIYCTVLVDGCSKVAIITS